MSFRPPAIALAFLLAASAAFAAGPAPSPASKVDPVVPGAPFPAWTYANLNAAAGPAKDAAKAKVADLKAQRKVEEAKLKQAQADEQAGDKDYRKAVKQGKKDKVDPLNCL